MESRGSRRTLLSFELAIPLAPNLGEPDGLVQIGVASPTRPSPRRMAVEGSGITVMSSIVVRDDFDAIAVLLFNSLRIATAIAGLGGAAISL